MKTLGQQMSHLGKQLETFGKEMEAATQKMRTDVAAIVARASAKGLVYSVGKTPTVSAAGAATH